MFDSLAKLVAHLLSWTFMIGLVGCLLVIPVAAFQLFSVLFQKDDPEEMNPTLQSR
jgi:hypothetical protein